MRVSANRRLDFLPDVERARKAVLVDGGMNAGTMSETDRRTFNRSDPTRKTF